MANETKKSLVEEALLQMKNLEEAVTENAKGILASTMKEEISELVKESLSEEEEVDAVEMEEGSNMGKESEMAEQEMELDIEDEVEDEMDLLGMDMDSDESELEMDMDDEEMDMDDVEDMLDMDLPGDEMEVDGEEEILIPLDLTGASDEEIMKVFKAMGEEDGIIISQDGDEVTLKDDEADVEYKIQMESEEDMGFEDEEEEIVYEIEVEDEDEDEDEGYEEEEMAEGYNDDLDDSLGARNGKKKQSFSDRRKESEGMEKAMGKKKYSGDKSMDEMEDGEATEGMVRSHAAGQKGSSQKSKGLPKPKSIPNRARYNESTEKEIQQLREKNEEYRKALNIFKEKLNEVAVFNSNLAYATRLFTENTTTKQEKINILRRFDSVETLKESKGLYKTFKEEFEGKSANTISESMSEKVSKSPSKGSSSNLIESKTYENPQFMRMKDLMSKIIK